MALARKLHKEGGDFCCSNETLIMATRVLIHEGEIPFDSVVFVFKEQELVVDRDGRLPVWPRGFCECSEDFLARLMAPKKSTI